MSKNSEERYFNTILFDIIDFLNEYEKLPCLWDRNHERFKDRKARLTSEEVLGEKLGVMDLIDLNTLRRKIRSVRGTYNTEIRKVKMSIEKGGEVYKPKLTWFPVADKFLRVTTDLSLDDYPLQETEGVSAKKKKLLQLPRKKGVSLVMIPLNKKRKKTQSKSDADIQDITQDDEEFEEYEALDPDLQELLEKDDENIKCEVLDDEEDDEVEFIENDLSIASNDKDQSVNRTELSDMVNCLKRLSSDNEFAAFGRSVGSQLQNMPLELAVQLQTDIQILITKKRLEYLKRSSQRLSDDSDIL